MEAYTAAGMVDDGFATVVAITVGMLETLIEPLEEEITDEVSGVCVESVDDLVSEAGLIVMSVVGFDALVTSGDWKPPDADKVVDAMSDAVGIGIESVLVSVNLGIEVDDDENELLSVDSIDPTEDEVDAGVTVFSPLPEALELFGAAILGDKAPVDDEAAMLLED